MPLQGYEAAKPMLYASVFPVDTTQLEVLFDAVDRLCLNDSSISVTKDQSTSLGAGLRCGFLGLLHMEVFNQRLSDEFDIDVVMTTPSVPYIVQKSVTLNKNGGEKVKSIQRSEIQCGRLAPSRIETQHTKYSSPLLE